MLQTTLMLEITYFHGFECFWMKRALSDKWRHIFYTSLFMTYQQLQRPSTHEKLWFCMLDLIFFNYARSGQLHLIWTVLRKHKYGSARAHTIFFDFGGFCIPRIFFAYLTVLTANGSLFTRHKVASYHISCKIRSYHRHCHVHPSRIR